MIFLAPRVFFLFASPLLLCRFLCFNVPAHTRISLPKHHLASLCLSAGRNKTGGEEKTRHRKETKKNFHSPPLNLFRFSLPAMLASRTLRPTARPVARVAITPARRVAAAAGPKEQVWGRRTGERRGDGGRTNWPPSRPPVPAHPARPSLHLRQGDGRDPVSGVERGGEGRVVSVWGRHSTPPCFARRAPPSRPPWAPSPATHVAP